MTENGGISMNVKKEINTNTLVAIVGFLSMFATIITVWNNLTFRQEESAAWHDDHEILHTKFNVEYEKLVESLQDRPQNIYRLNKVEERSNAVENRIDRIVENYNGRFADLGSQLNNVLTQLALTNAALSRLETAQRRSRSRMNEEFGTEEESTTQPRQPTRKAQQPLEPN